MLQTLTTEVEHKNQSDDKEENYQQKADKLKAMFDDTLVDYHSLITREDEDDC